MSNTTNYTDASADVERFLENAAVVDDFLPSPAELVRKTEKEKITIAIDKRSLELFKLYTFLLSDIDRMISRQDRVGHEIRSFSVQLEILINSRWRKAMRFDSADGHPHRHVFYPDGKEYREDMAAEDNNEAFTQAQAIVKKSFQEIHERYKLVLEKM